METVTLRGQDFKTVHNTLCELRSIQERLTGVISNDLADRLHSVVKGFEHGLADAYQQDNAAFDAKHDHYNEVREQLGLTTIWSVYDVKNLNERHPFEGATEVLYKDHWGQRAISKPVVGSTWAALYVAANACIRDSGDDHHIFIEQFVADQPQPGVLRLTTGS
jgi:hypothetical protein